MAKTMAQTAKMLKELDNGTSRKILAFLARNREKRINQSDITRATGIQGGNLISAVTRLRETGWIIEKNAEHTMEKLYNINEVSDWKVTVSSVNLILEEIDENGEWVENNVVALETGGNHEEN